MGRIVSHSSTPMRRVNEAVLPRLLTEIGPSTRYTLRHTVPKIGYTTTLRVNWNLASVSAVHQQDERTHNASFSAR